LSVASHQQIADDWRLAIFKINSGSLVLREKTENKLFFYLCDITILGEQNRRLEINQINNYEMIYNF